MPLLNRTAVRDELLKRLAAERPHLAEKLTRVSPSFYERLETQLQLIILAEVRVMPTVGTTIR